MKKQELILIVEDSESDIQLLKEATRLARITTRIEVVRDGQEALDYIRGLGRFSDRQRYPFPGVMFLDLKLPKVSGFEVLRFMKEHNTCRVIPVMVMSSSAVEDDIVQAYELGANCYAAKMGDFEGLIRFVEVAFRFWEMCELPPTPQGCE